MPNALEVPLPVRFIFILLTPKPSPGMDCHEIGRSFSTLMSNVVSKHKTFVKLSLSLSKRDQIFIGPPLKLISRHSTMCATVLRSGNSF